MSDTTFNFSSLQATADIKKVFRIIHFDIDFIYDFSFPHLADL